MVRTDAQIGLLVIHCFKPPGRRLGNTCFFLTIWGWFESNLVGGWALALWKIWLRQLGWWHSQLNGNIIQMFQSTNQMWLLGMAKRQLDLNLLWWFSQRPLSRKGDFAAGNVWLPKGIITSQHLFPWCILISNSIKYRENNGLVLVLLDLSFWTSYLGYLRWWTWKWYFKPIYSIWLTRLFESYSR